VQPGPIPIAKPLSPATLTSVKARADGTLGVTVGAPAAGKLLLEAVVKQSLLSAAPPKGTVLAAKASASVKSGASVTLTLRPTGRAKARLRKTGKLAVTLRLTFTPAGAKALTPLTRRRRCATQANSASADFVAREVEADHAERPRRVPRPAGHVLAAEGGVGVVLRDDVAELLAVVRRAVDLFLLGRGHRRHL
jgi:hypothetical protein